MSDYDPNKPLSDNVKLLGEILGNVLNEHEGKALFQLVEHIRDLSKQAHDNDLKKQQILIETLHKLSSKQIHGVVRSFSHFLNLANIAENQHRIRRTRWYQINQPLNPQKGSLAWCFKKLEAEGISKRKIKQVVGDIQLELVLTAHPTEVLRRTLIQKFDHIRHHLQTLDREDLTPSEYEAAQNSLKQEITAVWLTDEIRRKKPTPIDEAKWGLDIVENSLFRAVPEFMRELDANMIAYTGDRLPLDACPIRFGSWMGGDRDGNPFVTADVTRQVCWLSRWYAANLYEKALRRLTAELSMHACNDKLKQASGGAYEPYRAVLHQLREKLIHTRDQAEQAYEGHAVDVEVIDDINVILEPLLMCYRSLTDIGADVIANGALLDLIRCVVCFDLSLLRLDLRQEASVHTELMNALLNQNNREELIHDQDARQHFMVELLEGQASLDVDEQALSSTQQETWALFKLIKTQPRNTFGAYVISMASSPLDVLHVCVLQKLAGVVHMMRVVPLFETLRDLQQAGESFDALLSIKAYRELIHKHQEIMIGYSDSAKDAGILTAGWALYQAQEDLVEVSQKHKVQLTLFHGRGGTVGRGGAPAHMAIRSQPPGSVHGRLRITEQGEVIRNKYGFWHTAHRTLELYTSAIMDTYCNPPPQPEPAWRELMTKLSEHAKHKFRDTVYKNPEFYEYFQAVTPVRELGQLFIGSRPQKRSSQGGISDLRAIPWVFAWMQNRNMVPSWLGVGEALGSLDETEFALARQMLQKWPFFHSLISLIEMVLAKADPMIATHYELRLASDDLHEIGEQIRHQFALTTKQVLRCLAQEGLLKENPTLARSLKVRQPYVYPINILQAECLLRQRTKKQDQHQLDALLISISGIAAGMRNTG